MIKIGITGNIASGKSQAQKIISSLGYKVFDLDMTVHELFEKNEEVQNKIIEKFKTTDRKKIAEIVFSDVVKKCELENIIHPELKKYIQKVFFEYKDEKAVFVSGATIFEAGFENFFDKILLIEAEKELKIERLKKRNNLNDFEANLRLNSQNDNVNKTRYVIYNNTTLDDLEKNIKNILKIMLD